MTAGITWTCPVHGPGQRAAGMGDGIYCLAEDRMRPHGVCGRPCTDGRLDSTGELLREIGEHASSEYHSSECHRKEEANMGTYNVRKPGSLTCAECGADMAGEHNKAKRCTACRGAKARTRKAPAPEPDHSRALRTGPRSPVSRPAAEATDASLGGNGHGQAETSPAPEETRRPVLDRLREIEVVLRRSVRTGSDPEAVLRRIEALETGLAELRTIIIGQ